MRPSPPPCPSRPTKIPLTTRHVLPCTWDSKPQHRYSMFLPSFLPMFSRYDMFFFVTQKSSWRHGMSLYVAVLVSKGYRRDECWRGEETM
jgi:hypothetical protein